MVLFEYAYKDDPLIFISHSHGLYSYMYGDRLNASYLVIGGTLCFLNKCLAIIQCHVREGQITD